MNWNQVRLHMDLKPKQEGYVHSRMFTVPKRHLDTPLIGSGVSTRKEKKDVVKGTHTAVRLINFADLKRALPRDPDYVLSLPVCPLFLNDSPTHVAIILTNKVQEIVNEQKMREIANKPSLSELAPLVFTQFTSMQDRLESLEKLASPKKAKAAAMIKKAAAARSNKLLAKMVMTPPPQTRKHTEDTAQPRTINVKTTLHPPDNHHNPHSAQGSQPPRQKHSLQATNQR
jgi:hypothetical protein